MWKCKKVTYSLGLRYQVRCSETSTNCTVHERSTNRLHTVEKDQLCIVWIVKPLKNLFFFHEASQKSFWLPWRPSEMLELLQVSLVQRYLLFQKYSCRSPNGKFRCRIRGFCHQIRTCWSAGWPIVCLADQLPAVLLPGNAASLLCYNVLAVLRLYSRTFDLLHMQPSAKGSKSLNANQSGRSRNSCVEMRVGILTRNFHQGLGLRWTDQERTFFRSRVRYFHRE